VEETPWGWIGGGIAVLLALAGGIVVAKRRRKTAKPRAAVEPKVPLMARLRQRFARKKAVQEAVEPRMEEGTHDTSTQV
jgi:3-hydroxyacyl-CoA dehydrogenase